jgi:hypothetical protein
MDVIDMTDQTFQRIETKMANQTKTNNETDTNETVEITCTKGGLRPTRQLFNATRLLCRTES